MRTSLVSHLHIRHPVYGTMIKTKKDTQQGIGRTGSLLLLRGCTIVAVMMLNFCVRDGYRCVHHAIATRSLRILSKPDTISLLITLWSSPRPISTSQLRMSPFLHPWPINLIVFKGSYFLIEMGSLILEGASRLDAFSVYPFRTWLPSCATGVTTGAPSVRPPRSSRTKGSSPQTSYAHDR